MGFGKGAGANDITEANRRQIFLFLGPKMPNRFAAERSNDDIESDPHIYPGELLSNDRITKNPETGTAVLFRIQQPIKPSWAAFLLISGVYFSSSSHSLEKGAISV